MIKDNSFVNFDKRSYFLYFHNTLFSTGEKELSEISDPLQVSCSGGHLSDGDRIPYTLTWTKDQPIGEVPKIIKDDSKNLTKFKEVVELVKNENQVLILLENLGTEFNYESINDQLPEKSYTVHNDQNRDNKGAAEWVEYHMTRQEGDVVNEKYRFLIGDWYTSAGYEAPVVIFVTDDLTLPNLATCLQRAKAKLIIYHVTYVKDSTNTEAAMIEELEDRSTPIKLEHHDSEMLFPLDHSPIPTWTPENLHRSYPLRPLANFGARPPQIPRSFGTLSTTTAATLYNRILHSSSLDQRDSQFFEHLDPSPPGFQKMSDP